MTSPLIAACWGKDGIQIYYLIDSRTGLPIEFDNGGSIFCYLSINDACRAIKGDRNEPSS